MFLVFPPITTLPILILLFSLLKDFYYFDGLENLVRNLTISTLLVDVGKMLHQNQYWNFDCDSFSANLQTNIIQIYNFLVKLLSKSNRELHNISKMRPLENHQQDDEILKVI